MFLQDVLDIYTFALLWTYLQMDVPCSKVAKFLQLSTKGKGSWVLYLILTKIIFYMKHGKELQNIFVKNRLQTNTVTLTSH